MAINETHYFIDYKDIGQLEVALKIAVNSGLDSEKLKQALNDGRYQNRLENASTEAQRIGIRSIPSFVFENDKIVVGAAPPEIFRKALDDIRS